MAKRYLVVARRNRLCQTHRRDRALVTQLRHRAALALTGAVLAISLAEPLTRHQRGLMIKQ
jgi:hypothetical protein